MTELCCICFYLPAKTHQFPKNFMLKQLNRTLIIKEHFNVFLPVSIKTFSFIFYFTWFKMLYTLPSPSPPIHFSLFSYNELQDEDKYIGAHRWAHARRASVKWKWNTKEAKQTTEIETEKSLYEKSKFFLFKNNLQQNKCWNTQINSYLNGYCWCGTVVGHNTANKCWICKKCLD